MWCLNLGCLPAWDMGCGLFSLNMLIQIKIGVLNNKIIFLTENLFNVLERIRSIINYYRYYLGFGS